MRLLRWPTWIYADGHPLLHGRDRRLRVGRVSLATFLALGYLGVAEPTLGRLCVGLTIGGVGLILRGAAAGHLTKHKQLSTSGPYAYTRHPLYFGSLVIGAGLLIAAKSWLATAVLVVYFFAFYPAIIAREEVKLRGRYGPAFDEYAARVPCFWPRRIPRWGGWEFSWALWRRNGEFQTVLGFLAVCGALLLKARLWP